MIENIAQIFGEIIGFIYSYVPNFGVAIIILTLMVKLITYPLNNKQIQSTKRMQKLQPELKKIQQKYKDDKQKQNQAVSEFMKENNMNPLAGCLPLLVQFPFLIGIFRLLREPDIIKTIVEGRGDVFSPYLFQSAEFVNLTYLPTIIYGEAEHTILNQLTVNFADYGIYYLFPIIAGATTYLYSKMSMPADSSQKMMLYLMPGMITVFSFSFPIGLVIYWTMNNVFSLAQHKFINYLERLKGEEVVITQPKDQQDVKTKEVNAVENITTGSSEQKTARSSDKKTALKDGKTKKKKKGKGKK